MSKNELKSNIPHIVIVGDVNSGKSTLINNITNQSVSTISSEEGTTTDLVVKRTELLDFGPIILIDTPGLNDNTKLGNKRLLQTNKGIEQASLILYIVDASNYNVDYINGEIKKINKELVIVFNKIDLIKKEELILLSNEFKNALFVNSKNKEDAKVILEYLKNNLAPLKVKPLIVDRLKKEDVVLLVMPIDSEAPKGRIILPQMQVLRELLDNNMVSIVTQLPEVENAVKKYKPDVVITDSQVFKEVQSVVPKDILLTSFSIIFARQKGDLNYFVKNVEKLKTLNKNSKVLIFESCSHNISHEDIGSVKIPNLITKHIGDKPKITHLMGNDFPSDIRDYDLVIHCGSCMLNKEVMQERIRRCKEEDISITNYGIVLAFYAGILDESIKIFN